MGSILSRVFGSVFGKKEARVLILGLDNAGKTTLLYRLHSPQAVVRTAPTIGFNVETITVGNISMQAWDLGGQVSRAGRVPAPRRPLRGSLVSPRAPPLPC